MDKTIYSEINQDILTEIGNIGAGQASVAMSIMTGTKVDVHLTETKLSQPNDLIKENCYAGHDLGIIHFAIEGDLTGDAFFVLIDESAKRLIELVDKENKEAVEAVTDKDISILNEMGNIFVGTYLNALSDFTNMMVMPKLPEYESNKASDFQDRLLKKLQVGNTEETISVKTNLTISKENISVVFCLVFDKESITKIIDKTKLASVLIVDDSSFIRAVLKDNLREMQNIHVYEASNYDKALKIFKEKKPHLCFLDVVIGEKSGLDLCKEIKSKSKDTKVVFISSIGQNIIVEKAKSLGADDFLKKPFKREDIIKHVREM